MSEAPARSAKPRERRRREAYEAAIACIRLAPHQLDVDVTTGVLRINGEVVGMVKRKAAKRLAVARARALQRPKVITSLDLLEVSLVNGAFGVSASAIKSLSGGRL